MIASAVILAAGSGDRMRIGTNKIFLSVGGQPLISRTIRAFTQVDVIEEIILVVHPNEEEAVRALIQPLSLDIRLVEGGATRRDSALAGIQAASSDIVLIHDGARPFPTQALIRNVFAETEQGKAVIPVLPITDLLHKCVPGNEITALFDWDKPLARAQTPQGFDRELILRCLVAAPPEIRDDASAVLLSGHQVITVPGEGTNIKITSPDDLPLAEAIAAYLTT